MSWTPEDLLERLDAWEVDYELHRHRPVVTVEEAQEAKGDLPGEHTKNLFLRDKKGAMWLVVARHDRTVDLKALAPILGARGRFSFGSAERLQRHLGVVPGAVSLLALVNDAEGSVRVALDDGLDPDETWNLHPLANTLTLAAQGSAWVDVLRRLEHPPVWVALDEDALRDDVRPVGNPGG